MTSIITFVLIISGVKWQEFRSFSSTAISKLSFTGYVCRAGSPSLLHLLEQVKEHSLIPQKSNIESESSRVTFFLDLLEKGDDHSLIHLFLSYPSTRCVFESRHLRPCISCHEGATNTLRSHRGGFLCRIVSPSVLTSSLSSIL